MQIKQESLSETNLKLIVTATAQELAQAKKIALQKVAPNVKIAGFRPGHAPLEVVEKNTNPNQLQQDVINEALNLLYPQAVKSQNLRPVNNPDIKITKFVPYNNLEFEATIDVVGNIKIGDYKNIKVKKEEVKVTDKDVQEVLDRLQTQMAEYTEHDKPAKDTDRVWIDFEGTDSKKQPVKGATGKDYPLVLGSKTFIPGFEENLIGLKKDESKTFSINFPKDYGVKALQAKKVTFKVDIKKVESAKLPKIDTEFAKKAGNFTSVEDLKSDIKKQIKLEREHQAERDLENQIMQSIVKSSTVPLPSSMLEEQTQIIDQEFKQNLVYRGQTFKEYLDQQEITEDEYQAKELKPLAEERLKAGLILSEIADVEKITITPEELEIRMQVLKGQYQSDKAMQESLNKPDARRDVAARLLTEKTINKLIEFNK